MLAAVTLIAATSSNLDTLQRTLDFWEIVGDISTGIVVLGLVGEYVAEFWIKVRHTLKERLAKISILVLILGVTGELVSHKKASRISGQIVAVLNKTAADANGKAGLAEERTASLEREAANATEQAAKANERAAEANRVAEAERLARLKIEDRLADRRLTAEQQKVLADKLRAYPGMQGTLLYSADSHEVAEISKQLLAVFKNAGWTFGIFVGSDPRRAVSGILVEIPADAGPATRIAAKTLVDSLAAENLYVTGPEIGEVKSVSGTWLGTGSPSNATIRLTIGKK
jgi:hypothetical protein